MKRVALKSGALSLTLLVSMVLTGCGPDDATSAEDSAVPVELTDRSFLSDSVTGRDLVEGSQISFTFQGERLAVLAGCNTMAGAYTHDGETLAWDGPAISTRMACEPELMEQDEWLNTLLADGVATTADGADLVLTAGDISIQLSEVVE